MFQVTIFISIRSFSCRYDSAAPTSQKKTDLAQKRKKTAPLRPVGGTPNVF
jgi:hypothetical protein